MGLKLMIEVLDHYRGPDHKFRLLMAFAESANEHTRTGWPGRELLARRTGKSPSRISHMMGELVADGVIEREGGGGRRRGTARYILLPLKSQGASMAHSEAEVQSAPSTHPNTGSQGAPATHSQGAPATHSQGARPITQPAETVLSNPSYEPSVEPSGANPPTAHTILSDFIDWDRDNGGTLTRRTIGQLSKHIGALLTEGVDDRHIRCGLADWRAKGLPPSMLDSFVNAAMNGHRRQHRPSTGDRAIAEGEALKAQLRDRKELA